MNAEQVAVRSALQEARSLASTAQPAGQDGAQRRDELIVGLDVALWNLDRLDPELRDEPVDGPALEDLLRRHAGVQVTRNGGPGQTAGYFVRGAGTSSTVVLVDGVRVPRTTEDAAP